MSALRVAGQWSRAGAADAGIPADAASREASIDRQSGVRHLEALTPGVETSVNSMDPAAAPKQA
eukprot:6748085-Alexandrium_andersonii.AAC.1